MGPNLLGARTPQITHTRYGIVLSRRPVVPAAHIVTHTAARTMAAGWRAEASAAVEHTTPAEARLRLESRGRPMGRDGCSFAAVFPAGQWPQDLPLGSATAPSDCAIWHRAYVLAAIRGSPTQHPLRRHGPRCQSHGTGAPALLSLRVMQRVNGRLPSAERRKQMSLIETSRSGPARGRPAVPPGSASPLGQ